MKLYKPNKYRGAWHFSNEKEMYALEKSECYAGFYQDLGVLLNILYRHNMLKPQYLNLESGNVKIDFLSIENTVNEICKLGNVGYLSIKGDTVIYTDSGEEIYSDIFSIELMSCDKQEFTISTKSDIWLPMAFDDDSFSFVWNLEYYKLNYSRVDEVLKEVNETLKWKENSINKREHYERGNIQVGYRMFLAKDVIEREFELKPNKDFDLNLYIAEMEACLHTY